MTIKAPYKAQGERLAAALSACSAAPKGRGEQAWLARKLRVKSPTVSNWIRGVDRPTTENIKAAADLLGVTVDYLLLRENLKTDGNQSTPKQSLEGRAIRVLSYTEAAAHSQRPQGVSEPMPSIWVDDDAAQQLSPKAFALEISDSSMAPEFSIGDVVIIDPDVRPAPGDCVVATVPGETASVFRECRFRGAAGFELAPLNAHFASYLINPPDTGAIIGTMMEHRRRSKLKRRG